MILHAMLLLVSPSYWADQVNDLEVLSTLLCKAAKLEFITPDMRMLKQHSVAVSISLEAPESNSEDPLPGSRV